MDFRMNWTFAAYIDQIFSLSAILEVPGIAEQRVELIKEVWGKFPNECVALGLKDGV